MVTYLIFLAGYISYVLNIIIDKGHYQIDSIVVK